MGLAPAFAGEVGYHKRNDPNGDGIACDLGRSVRTSIVAGALKIPEGPGAGPVVEANAIKDEPAQDTRQIGAKFVRP